MKFRYSAINTAYDCYAKYKYLYIDGLEQEGKGADMVFGTAIHLGIKAHFDGEDPMLTFSMYWNSIKNEPLQYYRFNWEKLNELGNVFLSRFVKLHAKKFKPFKMEERISMELGGYTIEGTPDLIGEFEGVPSIVDWKTSSTEFKKRKIQTNEQMYIYAKMAEIAYGYSAKQIVYLVFIKGEERIQTIKHEITPAKVNLMLGNVEIMIRDLASRKEWPRNPSCYCVNPTACFGEELKRG